MNQEQLRAYWYKHGGAGEHIFKGRKVSPADNFVSEVEWFLEHNCPPLITDSNKRHESIESQRYANVAKQCEKLLAALQEIPEGDRINILAPRERNELSTVTVNGCEIDRGPMPMCDPVDFVDAVREIAGHYSHELKRPAKGVRQLAALREFIKRYQYREDSPLYGITRNDFLDLACILWPGMKRSSFEKVFTGLSLTQ